jgi:hypothetical protein
VQISHLCHYSSQAILRRSCVQRISESVLLRQLGLSIEKDGRSHPSPSQSTPESKARTRQGDTFSLKGKVSLNKIWREGGIYRSRTLSKMTPTERGPNPLGPTGPLKYPYTKNYRRKLGQLIFHLKEDMTLAASQLSSCCCGRIHQGGCSYY